MVLSHYDYVLFPYGSVLCFLMFLLSVSLFYISLCFCSLFLYLFSVSLFIPPLFLRPAGLDPLPNAAVGGVDEEGVPDKASAGGGAAGNRWVAHVY